MGDFLGNFVSILAQVIVMAIIVRALLSWFMPGDSNALNRLLAEVTDPVLVPVRRVLPPIGGLDLSPILAIIMVYLLSSLLVQVIHIST